jgi:hypothetical protein
LTELNEFCRNEVCTLDTNMNYVENDAYPDFNQSFKSGSEQIEFIAPVRFPKTENHDNVEEESKSIRHVYSSEPQDVQQAVQDNEAPKKSHDEITKSLAEGELISEREIGDIKLQVMKGILWLQKTDVIVNPCENTQLRHEKGIAKTLFNYAGPNIYDSSNELVFKAQKTGLIRGHAYETGPGLLNCKRLVHAILEE